jgi:2-methylisocitrate lyase-like PEP mutase family enzyme
METLKKITVGTTLFARSIGDYECIFQAEVISRTAKFAFVLVHGDKGIKRCKIYVHDGAEFIYALGQYSMCPIFKAK